MPVAPVAPVTAVISATIPGPGIVAEITALSGATGAGGSFRPGDQITVTFTLEQRDGTKWGLDEMTDGRITIAGPTFSYQRVVAEIRDAKDRRAARGAAPPQGLYLWNISY